MRLIAVLVLALAPFGSACSGGTRTNVLMPDGSPSYPVMDFREPLPLDPVPAGWHHRTFFRHPPMDISFVTKDGFPAIRMSTKDSASMLFRYVDIQLDQYPVLRWNWLIEQPIVSDVDEMTVEGDDHPVRLYLGFESAEGDSHAMEIIWGNRALRRGDWKHLKFFGKSFPHYVANGGAENAGRWHRERVVLTELYSKLWGDPAGSRLVEVALFCDTDDTGAESTAYVSDVRVETDR